MFRRFHETTTFKITGLATKLLFQVMDLNVTKQYGKKLMEEEVRSPCPHGGVVVTHMNTRVLSHSECISKRKELVQVLAEALKNVIDYTTFAAMPEEKQSKITNHLVMRLEEEANKYQTRYTAEFDHHTIRVVLGLDTYFFYRETESRIGNGICWNWVEDPRKDMDLLYTGGVHYTKARNGICWRNVRDFRKDGGVRYTKACFPEDLFLNAKRLTEFLKSALIELGMYHVLDCASDRVNWFYSNCGSRKVHKLFDTKSIDFIISEYTDRVEGLTPLS